MSTRALANLGREECQLSALDRLRGEQWLARCILRLARVDVLHGVTDSGETRKERFRTVIRERGIAMEPAAHSGGRCLVLVGEAFERLYGERV